MTDDVTITNNVIKNASSAVNFSPSDPYCGQTPGCTNPGEVKRVVIRNNLFLLGDTTQPGWSKGYGMGMLINPPNATDLVFQHNTVVPPPNLGYCAHSVYFEAPRPPVYPLTHNVWIVDNVLCRQVRGGGSNGFVGQFPASLTNFMGNVPPVSARFAGNVMFLAPSEKEYPLPPGNHATSSRPNDAEGANYYLKYPAKMSTTDGQVAGVDKSKLADAFAAESGVKVQSRPSTTGSDTQH